MFRSNKKFVWIFIVALVLFWIVFSGFRFAKKVYAAASNEKEQFIYNGPVSATAKGKTAIGISFRYLQKEGQYFLFLGRVVIKGKITPATASVGIPGKIRIQIKHKSATGKVLTTFNFDVNVQSNGAILTQTLPFSTFDLINKNEFLELTVVPVDKNLPAGKLNLNVTHFIGTSASFLEEDSAENESAIAPILVVNISEFEGGARKGENKGPFLYKALNANGYPFNGFIRFKGKIIRTEPSEHLPPTLRFTFKREDPITKKAVNTTNLDVKVESDGRILLQSFPFTSDLVQGKPELFQVSFHAVGEDLPEALVKVKLSFTPLTATP